MPGTISGTVVDKSGAAVAGARVTLAPEGAPAKPEVVTGDDGQFSFSGISAGNFQITVAAPSFASQTYSGTLHPGEICIVPPIALAVATAITEVKVVASQEEIAEAEIKEQEAQRVLGFLPNFYVSYVADAQPLSPKQKFELAWKTTIDPITFGLTAVSAAISQAQNQPSAWGQGADGYGKRFGAAYADMAVDTLIGNAILPSLLKQDPRYFYKGTGSTRSRILYALANAVICKGDNRKWQANYSGILGSLATGGISNLYYPPKDRGAGLVFQNTAIGIGAVAAANLFQEFLVKKFTPNLPKHDPAKP
jgi:hypothetical protein